MTREDYRMAMEQERHDEGYPEPVEVDEDAVHDRRAEERLWALHDLEAATERDTAAAEHMGQAMGRILGESA